MVAYLSQPYRIFWRESDGDEDNLCGIYSRSQNGQMTINGCFTWGLSLGKALVCEFHMN